MYNYCKNKLYIIGGEDKFRVSLSAASKNTRGASMKKVVLCALVVFSLLLPSFAKAETIDIDEILSQKRAELEGTEWLVEMRPLDGGKNETDVVSFYSGQVSSRNMMNQGFAPTSYSLRLEENGNFTWETTQAAGGGAMASWRGDIVPDGMMSGMLSVNNGRGKTVNYSFAGSSVR